AMSADARRQTGGRELLPEQGGKLEIETAQIDMGFAAASVNGKRHIARGGQRKTVGMIEAMARDVQIAVGAIGLESLEDEQAVLRSRHELRQLRSADLDASAV